MNVMKASSRKMQEAREEQRETTKQDFQLNTNYDETTDIDRTQLWEQITTVEPYESLTTDIDKTQQWQEYTTEEPTEKDIFTATQQATTPITSSAECSQIVTRDILEETKKEIINTILSTISLEITKKLEDIEGRLATLICSNDKSPSAIELSWQIYENLQIPLTGWLFVFDQPYNHRTRLDDLNQIAGICHNQVIVTATFNESISLATVGPASVLTLNTSWNQPQQFWQVYWCRKNGKSFGFSPLPSIRQTSADNEDLNSLLRLSWLLDQNIGGYRAGAIRSFADNSLWHKVIYCN
ncbi:unnamed protein product [Rotaria socialis]|uniref:Uncharacterized protein n=2 Tax=Rotaria socialis TaxID=392032 RepID=A0A817Z0G5_9BILA|nr:unnamed protein product [Rotaria socialis]CAF3627377.1 unnamed protein product [Rotaria socialis]CAF4313034.1 unnamed protein product [Rotaria socialis]CAF4425214.1 unnamed protein product [Rotaria socialis]CAF4485368.1 unnamed protein product [Rotaria socialis]